MSKTQTNTFDYCELYFFKMSDEKQDNENDEFIKACM
jgi:hypothetical protein